MKTLHVIPHSCPGGITRELTLLLEGQESDARVCCFNGQRVLDPRPLWQLASTMREFQPELILAWCLPALRAARLVAPKAKAVIAVRGILPRNGDQLSRFDRWLLKGADRILAANQAEADRCAAAGLAADRIRVVPRGVRKFQLARQSQHPRILCAGALEPHKGFYEAIWAFDILRFTAKDVELTIAGEGPERRRLEKFAARTNLQDRIHLPGKFVDIAPFLSRASLAWVPSLADTGAGVALEAMAGGLPVIASRVPELAEIVVDGVTGFLVAPGDKMELARKTRRLLDDAALARQMGEAGRQRVAQFYSAQAFVETWRAAVSSASFSRETDFCCHPALPA